MSLLDQLEAMWRGLSIAERLAEAERLKADWWFSKQVRILDPLTTFIGQNVDIGQDTVIGPNVIILGPTKIGRNCKIGPDTIIESSTLEWNVRVGPFCRIREGSHLEHDAYVGTHVELKNCRIGAETKIPHRAYIGDAEIGKHCNIGAGFTTANWDGENHSRTKLGDGVFVGINVSLVAPVTIADEVGVAAGSVISKDITTPHSLAICRARTTKIIPDRVYRTDKGWRGLSKRCSP